MVMLFVARIVVASLFVAGLAAGENCDEVQFKCANRKGCGIALHAYMYQCASVLGGHTKKCPLTCQKALAALTSTVEGQALITCECGDSEMCRQSKLRAEVCRAEVERLTAPGAKIPCSVAHWICAAEPLCATALDYYFQLCRSMFHGRKCTARCNNSLAILDRQPRADTLRSCYCDGTEEFPCQKIKDNSARLCYGIEPSTTPPPDASSATWLLHSGYLTCFLMACVVVLSHLGLYLNSQGIT